MTVNDEKSREVFGRLTRLLEDTQEIAHNIARARAKIAFGVAANHTYVEAGRILEISPARVGQLVAEHRREVSRERHHG